MNKTEKVMTVWDVTMMTTDGNSIGCKFISKSFMKDFIYSSALPVGIKASHFGAYQVEDRLFASFDGICIYVNNNGGWRVSGWVKRGKVQDQGVDQPNNGLPFNASRTTVESGLLNYHIVELQPMSPMELDLEVLNRLKFDVTTGFET